MITFYFLVAGKYKLTIEFATVAIRKVPREQNARVNILSKLAVVDEHQRIGVIFEIRSTPSVYR